MSKEFRDSLDERFAKYNAAFQKAAAEGRKFNVREDQIQEYVLTGFVIKILKFAVDEFRSKSDSSTDNLSRLFLKGAVKSVDEILENLPDRRSTPVGLMRVEIISVLVDLSNSADLEAFSNGDTSGEVKDLIDSFASLIVFFNNNPQSQTDE